ncbi:MAG: beta strand repeat-containing protein, partial [Saprospiraceae bacterium]
MTGPTGITLSGNLTANGGTGSSAGTPGNFTFSTNNATVSAGGNNDGQTAGVINGGAFTKNGTGTVQLSGANTYSGLTTVSAGVLNIRNATATGTTAGGVTVASGAALEIQGGISVGAEALTLNGDGISSGGALRNVSGTNTWGGVLTLGSNASAAVNADQLTLSGDIALAGNQLLLAGASGATGIASGTISSTGTGSLRKDGAGTWTISGNNTFTGGVQLNSGTLNINNANALGTVAGTFTIGGAGNAVTINNTTGGTITTANYPMSWNDDFTFTGTSALNLGTGTVTLQEDRQATVFAGPLTVGGGINDNTKNLIKSGTGTLNFGSQSVTLGGLTIGAGTITATSGTISLAGNFSNSGTFINNGGTVVFNGSGTQTLGGSSATTFNNLTVNNSGAGLTLSTSQTVNGTLNLTDGLVTTGANSITVGVSGSITNASVNCYIDGNLCRGYNAVGPKIFPIGKGGNYRPLTFNYTALTGTSFVCSEQFETSMTGPFAYGIVEFPDRKWLVTQSGGSAFTYSISLDGTGFTPFGAPLILKKEGVTITANSASFLSPNYTASGLTALSEFALAYLCADPIIDVQPVSPPEPLCPSSGIASFSVSASGEGVLTYQWQESITGSGGAFEDIYDGGVYSGTDGPTLTITNPPVDMNGYAYRVIITRTCGSFATSDRMSVLTVNDQIPPTPVCAEIPDVTLDENGAGNLPDDAAVGNSTDNCSIASATSPAVDVTCDNLGSNSVVLTVTDGSGNTATADCSYMVVDETAPMPVCADIPDVTLDDNGSGTLPADAAVTVTPCRGCKPVSGSTDNCSVATETSPEVTVSCDDIAGPNTVVLTVTDGSGNTSTTECSFSVVDITAPTPVCQDVTVSLDEEGNGSTTAENVDDGSTDACVLKTEGGLVLDQTEFTCSDVGTSVVTLTVTDVNGNTSTCTATVTVEDGVAPTAVCHDVTVSLDADGNGSTTAAEVDNGSTDACGLMTADPVKIPGLTPPTDGLVLDLSEFTCSDVGTSVVTLTVTDVNGNTSTCTATVTIEDIVPPMAVCQDVTVNLDADGNGSTTAADVDNGSTDACGLLSATPGRSSGATPTTDGLVLDQTEFTCDNVVGPNVVTLTVTDVNGNTSTCTAMVTVEDGVAPTAVCQDVTVSLDADGNGSTTAAEVDNGSTDDCGLMTDDGLVLDFSEFTCSDVGASVVTLTVTDVNGNTSTCTATVTIEDIVPPMAVCQDVTVSLDADGNGSTTAAEVDNGS